MLVLFDISCVAFLFALVLSPLVRDLALRQGWVDLPDHDRKIHAQPIPRLGGVAIAIAYILALVFLLVAPYRNLNIDLGAASASAMRLMPAALVVFGVGIWDDLHQLKPRHKLVGQAIAGLLAYFAGFSITSIHGYDLGIWISLPLTVFWLVGCANALNLIDGMDGLAAGVGFFAALTALVSGLVHNNLELALVTAPLCGALLGFLRYNFNPATIFLGDSGSLLIGFLLGAYGIVWSQKAATALGMTAPLMAMAIPLLEVALSVCRRFLRNEPIFGADRGHIHHRLLDQGITARRAALMMYAACGLAAALSLLQDMLYNRFGGLIIILFCGAAWIGIQHLGYAEFGIASRLLLRGTLRGIINVQLRLQQFENAMGKAGSVDALWELIGEACRDFGFQRVRMQLGSEVREQWIEPTEKHLTSVWQLRIELPEGQYVNLYRDATRQMHPMVMTTFGQILERTLRVKAVLAMSAPPPPVMVEGS